MSADDTQDRTERRDKHILEPPEEGEMLGKWPLVASLATYAIVSGVLYVETGSPDAGLGWPVITAIAVLLIGFGWERHNNEQ